MVGMQFLIVLGSGAFLLGLAVVIWISITKQRGHGTPNWPKVAGRVLESKVTALERETPEGMVTTYTPLVRYEYAVAGEVYTGRRFAFQPGETVTTKAPVEAARVVAAYPVATKVDVFYNAANPKQAALKLPKPAAHNAVLFFGITNMVMGGVILTLGILLLSR